MPPQTYAPAPVPAPQPAYIPAPQPVYYAAPQQSFSNPISGALAWKAGIANNLVSGISNGFNGLSSGIANSIQQPVGYSYGAPPPPPPPQPIAAAAVPNKPLYVVCDNNSK